MYSAGLFHLYAWPLSQCGAVVPWRYVFSLVRVSPVWNLSRWCIRIASLTVRVSNVRRRTFKRFMGTLVKSDCLKLFYPSLRRLTPSLLNKTARGNIFHVYFIFIVICDCELWCTCKEIPVIDFCVLFTCAFYPFLYRVVAEDTPLPRTVRSSLDLGS